MAAKTPDCSLPSLLRFSIWCSKCCWALIICCLKKWCQLRFQFSGSCRHWLSAEVNKLVCLRNFTAPAWWSVAVLCLSLLHGQFVAHPKLSHGARCPVRRWLRHCSDTQLLMINSVIMRRGGSSTKKKKVQYLLFVMNDSRRNSLETICTVGIIP